MAWGSQGAVFLGEDLMHSAATTPTRPPACIDEEVERILREQEDRGRELLTEHRHGLDLVAEALLEHETIDGAEVARIVHEQPRRRPSDASAGDDVIDKPVDPARPIIDVTARRY